MRKFFLENEYGERYNLQNVSAVLFDKIGGLGVTYDITYSQIGNKFVSDQKKISQSVITGNLEFVNNPYRSYQEFTSFIMRSEDLKLIYKPLDIEYYRDIDIAMLDKGEIVSGYLSCPISINSKSLYYLKKENSYKLKPTVGGSKWDIKWDFKFTDSIESILEINNQGQTYASFSFILKGYADTPRVDAYYNGQKIDTITFNTVVEQGEELWYCNKDSDTYVFLKKENGELVNLIDCLDLNNDNFFKLKFGITNLFFSAKDSISEVDLIMYEEYVVV